MPIRIGILLDISFDRYMRSRFRGGSHLCIRQLVAGERCICKLRPARK